LMGVGVFVMTFVALWTSGGGGIVELHGRSAKESKRGTQVLTRCVLGECICTAVIDK
jgi:hypothetical protein